MNLLSVIKSKTKPNPNRIFEMHACKHMHNINLNKVGYAQGFHYAWSARVANSIKFTDK